MFRNIYHTSDIRDKTDFQDIQTALPFINSIHPTTFVHNDRADYIQINEKGEQYFDEKSYLKGIKKGHRRISGFRAQEVYEALKNNYNSDNYASVVSYGNYTGNNGMDKYFLSEEAMVPFLTRAIQEQQEQIEALKSEIADLKNIIKDKNKPNKINEEVEEKSNENESNENE